MTKPFFAQDLIRGASWQSLERAIVRYAISKGFENVRQVGGSGDGGGDVVATMPNRSGVPGARGITWLFQAKHHQTPIGADVLDETLAALLRYRATKPVVVCTGGFDRSAYLRRNELSNSETKVMFDLWGPSEFEERGRSLSDVPPLVAGGHELRDYQEAAVTEIVSRYRGRVVHNALVVLATGLGKTLTAAEAIRRIGLLPLGPRRIPELAPGPPRTLVLAHSTDLIRQLERGFWPVLTPSQATCIVDGVDKPDSYEQLSDYSCVFATRQSVASAIERGVFPTEMFDIVVVDECHHLGSREYEMILDELAVGTASGPFLIGLSATPWRPDGTSLDHRFDDPVIEIGLHEGLRRGFLSTVDYRMMTDDIDWDSLRRHSGESLSARQVNRTLFIPERDEGVVERIAETWHELEEPRRGLVFCGTISHAETISRKINELGFARADTLLSTKNGHRLTGYEKSRKLMDFDDGTIQILCAVDVLNEGIDTPSVNLVVFQRQTHSRRIFIQQLGRGLRIARGKSKVVVLDFVSDIKRLAEAAHLKDEVEAVGPKPGNPMTVRLGNRVTFQRAGTEDLETTEFLRQWLADMDAIARDEGDPSVLKFPRFDF